MVESPKISPTIPKRRVETTKLKRIVPHYTYRAEQPEDKQAEAPKPSFIRRLLRLFVKIFVVIGALFVAPLILGIIAWQNQDQTDNQQPAQPVNGGVDGGADKAANGDSDEDRKGVGDGLCSTDADCNSFGAGNCDGGSNVRCGSDNLCHCCLTLRGETCISCSTGCGGGTYCERDACVFNLGGRTSD